ncbi:pilus assembly FimT family protein [Vibrio hippocampi]|uniref:Prepilin-type N-terminal cleavage/methylation domain-containing protein n=1 Tax=Vibrio hippocampi TaxID=654686 RepID=A0ABM8ZP48_9VIBR|nr:prepilin-type N-terminal cleavage/methylation domain-containing protein [Vibrio hippocampi]CAH0530233.1 hypothetical protein VHP8226_03913 [Vibrio hippocampi]
MTTYHLRGFTLIEMVISIVIMAVLAVIAAPRFLNLQQDSKQATVEGVSAALASSLKLAESRIIIDNATQSIDYAGENISLTGNMPAASADTLRALLHIDVPSSWTRNWWEDPCDEPEFCILGNMYVGKGNYVEVPGFPLDSNGGLDRASYIWPRGYTLQSEGCYAFYINKASAEVYHTGAIVSGC